MKIEINTRIFIILIFATALFSLTLILINWINNRIGSPEVFVQNRTFATKSDIFYNYEITKYPSKVGIVNLMTKNASNIIGVSTDPWIIDFGIIPVGENFAQKTINLANKNKEDAKIRLKAFGNISSMVSFNRNNFYLKGNETIYAFLNVTKNTEPGNYTGEIDIIIQREKFG